MKLQTASTGVGVKFASWVVASAALVVAGTVVVALGAPESASAQQPGTGTLVVVKDCLIVGPDGKIQDPPPPEGQFELELSRGVSTPQQYVPEEIIESFTVACGESRTFEGLEPGSYNVLELDSSDEFGQTANFCINAEVEASQTTECNLTNEKLSNVRPPATGDAGLRDRGSGGGIPVWSSLALAASYLLGAKPLLARLNS